MDDMSPQQQQDSVGRSAGQQDNKRWMKSQSYRRQSAPSLVITKALIRSKTLSRESFLVPFCPESCSLVQSFLAASDRSFLLHGHAQLKTGMQTQDRHLFLFTDILVIAKAKSANHFKQKTQVCVCEMWTAGCMDEVCEGSMNPERSFVMGWPVCNCVATFSSAEQKDRWLSLLKSRIKEEKEQEEPKTIPLRVYGKGINTFAVTKTLPVSNVDSTNEVIRLALQQFSVIGNVKDFQLWVISKRDNAPYPLIGHEFPFSIQMSHVRHTMSQGGSGGVVGGADRQRAMQAEQMQVYKQCQFIMKPRPVETLQVPTEWSQKPFKRRRSLITWAFWRGSSSHLNELSLASTPRGCLFAQPLSAVCLEDALPKPVMEMMAFLYHEGSWTRGIFRRPAGARAVRELRDSLDAGEFHLPLSRDHVFVIAGVFKDFLRSIPSSLFCCELYEEWIDVLEEEDEEEEQVQDVKRMIRRLPKHNALLLRYLLAMLHGIQSNAHENQMTSFNLSVCIAPSMLWPPGEPCSPEVEGEGTKKVCELVKFMIEHCQQILGEDPCSLFGGAPQRLADETGSDSWLYPLTDSSYDSLENELDNSSGSSPGLCTRKHTRTKPLQGSLDSILTFSDNDQDTDPDLTHTDSPQGLKLRPLGRTRSTRQDPSQDVPTTNMDSLSLDGRQRLRRRSEPAIAYVAKFQGVQASRQTRRNVDVSSPSLSSNPTSPTHTRSSLESLDSLDPIWATSRGVCPASSSPSEPSTTSSDQKEVPNWGTLKGYSGLHPNSWLKKGRRLSLTQQDTLEKEDEDKQGGKCVPEKAKSAEMGKPNQAKTKTCRAPRLKGGDVKGRSSQEPLNPHQSSSPPSHHRSTGSLQIPKPPWSSDSPVTTTSLEEKQLPSLFYKPTGPSLSLFRQHKPRRDGESNARLNMRRGSEPLQQVVNQTSTMPRARLPSDPGLKVPNADPQGGTSPGRESRFCLSPYATKAVRDYFSSHPCSHPQSSQQVTLALVESRREWLKRCSDPSAEADFDQLLFAEESYV